MAPTNPFLTRLKAGVPQIGICLDLASPLATEVVAGAGFDWALIDMEHGPNDLHTVLAQLQVLAGYDTTALVRPTSTDPIAIKRLLDLGAPGLLLPMVQSVAQARDVVAATRFPPYGSRGIGGATRANGFGRAPRTADSPDSTVVLVQVETREALTQAEAIAAVAGIDGVFFGPRDIAADLGHLGDPSHKDVWALILPVAMRLIAKGIPVGTHMQDTAFAKRLISAGFTYMACATDTGVLARSSDAHLAEMRSKSP